jgi:hypothetical protein
MRAEGYNFTARRAMAQTSTSPSAIMGLRHPTSNKHNPDITLGTFGCLVLSSFISYFFGREPNHLLCSKLTCFPTSCLDRRKDMLRSAKGKDRATWSMHASKRLTRQE